MANNLNDFTLQMMIKHEVDRLENQFKSSSSKGETNAFLCAENFVFPGSLDKKKGCPILAQSFVGFNVVHKVASNPGTSSPGALIVYLKRMNAFSFVEHVTHQHQKNSHPIWIAVHTYDAVAGHKSKPEPKLQTKIAAVFTGSLLYQLPTEDNCFLIFTDLVSYACETMRETDANSKGKLQWQVISTKESGHESIIKKAMK